MIIAASLTGQTIKSPINSHFGHCPYFGVYNTKSKEFKLIENTFWENSTEAGTLTADLLLKNNIEWVITGRFGSKAIEQLCRNNIRMIVPEEGQTFEQLITLIKHE